MSQRLTVNSILNSRVPARLNVCSDDPRLYDWINAFQERAWSYGRWWGSTQLMQFCIDDEACLVLPREVAVIEAASLNGVPLQSANQWFSFVRPHLSCATAPWGTSGCFDNSPVSSGSCNCGCRCTTDFIVQQKGTVASYAVTTGTNKKLRIYPGSSADAGKKIIFQGKDANGIWVRTTIDGSVQDGEQVTLALPFSETVTTWGPGAPYAVIKEPTSYRVLVYALNTDDDTESQLAEYAPSETLPTYQRMQIPRLCCSTSSCSTSRSLLAVASLQHIPVTSGNDFLLYQNLQAYSDGMMGEKFREDGNITAADAYFFGNDKMVKPARGTARVRDGMGAIPLLRAELQKMTGDTCSTNIQFTTTNLQGFL